MIPIKNIYYMLSYAFKALQEKGFKNLETEDFHNVVDMYAAILIKGVSLQIKRGFIKSYELKSEPLTTLKGKIDISESIKTNSLNKRQLYCHYDEFTENTYLNRIIKSTLILLLKADIEKSRKKEIKKLLLYFNNIDTLDLHQVQWNTRYNRNNHTYRLLISICQLVFKGMLQSSKDGNSKLMNFIDDQAMSNLYEKFILEYYRKEHKNLNVSSSKIDWQLDDDNNYLLPDMKADIVIKDRSNKKILIIDAKYYQKNLSNYYETNKIHSFNLYQIFTYVKNESYNIANQGYEISGMLLYAKTESEIQPLSVYEMSGNRISVNNLNLDDNFENIRNSLDNIINTNF